MTAARLAIGRLSTLCLAPDDFEAPHLLRRDVDRLASELPVALGRMLAPLGGEGGVCLIRRLEIDVPLDLDRSAQALRESWASAIASGIARAISGGDGVVRYAGRAEQLAAFLEDLADGDAWSYWRHAPFEGLRSLPTAVALRTALLADPALGLSALALLAPRRLFDVVRALGETQAAFTLDGFVDRTAGAPPDVATFVAALAERTMVASGSERQALALVLRICPDGRRPTASEASVARACARILDASRSSFIAGRHEELAAQEIERACAEWAADDRRALLRALAADARTAQVHETRFGGLFLLLEPLDTVSFDLKKGPEISGVRAELFLRFLILANAAGEQSEAVFFDPVWRRLFGIPPGLSTADVEAWAVGLPRPEIAAWARSQTAGREEAAVWPDLPRTLAFGVRRAVGAIFEAFSRRLPGFAGSTPDYLRRNFLDAPATVSFDGESVEATLGRPPLDVILAMSAAADTTLTLPWLGTRPIRIRRGG